MKKLITVLALLFAISAFAQEPQKEVSYLTPSKMKYFESVGMVKFVENGVACIWINKYKTLWVKDDGYVEGEEMEFLYEKVKGEGRINAVVVHAYRTKAQNALNRRAVKYKIHPALRTIREN